MRRASISSTVRRSPEVHEYGAAGLGAAAVLLPWTWSIVRHVVTLVHEAGHAVVAVLTGRRLRGIRLHRDTSGLTTSVGRPRGPGMVATALAGYLAAPALGLGLAWLVAQGRVSWALWIALAVLAGMLVFIRNWFGLLVVAAAAAVVSLLVWRSTTQVQQAAALAFAWLLLVGGVRTCVELLSTRRRSRSRTSDADVLARLTHLPAAVWNAVFLLAALAALLPAARLLGQMVG